MKIKFKFYVKNFIFLTCMFYIITYISLPAARYYFSGILAKAVFVIVCGICLLIAALYSSKWINWELNHGLVYYVIFALILLVNIFMNRVGNGANNVFDIFVLYIMMGIGMFLLFVNKPQWDKFIIKIYFICLIITSITTIIGLSINSSYARALTSSSTNTALAASIERMNIGAFDFIYSLVLVLLPCIAFGKVLKKKRFYFIANIILIGLMILTIFEGRFTLSYLLTVFVIFLNFLPNRMRRSRFVLVSFLAALMLIIIGKPIITIILEFLDSISTSILMKMKLADLLNVVGGTGTLGDATSRIGLMKNSVDSFFNNPIFGVGTVYTNYSVVGGHSQVLDDFARYGIIGVSVLYVPICSYFNKLLKSEKNYAFSNLYLCLIITYVFLALVNPCTSYYISLTVYIIIPAMIRSVSNENEKSCLYN